MLPAIKSNSDASYLPPFQRVHVFDIEKPFRLIYNAKQKRKNNNHISQPVNPFENQKPRRRHIEFRRSSTGIVSVLIGTYNI